VSNVHVAEFDDFSMAMDGADLNRMVEEKLGPAWERVVRETSSYGESQTLIFVHPEGDRMGLFVVDSSGRELDVVQASVDAAHLSVKLDEYSHHGRHFASE
jgi:hypothetical protein